MAFQLYRQLLRLDLSNDHLLQLYYVLYYALPEEEKKVRKNIQNLISTREEIKPELRKEIAKIKDKAGNCRIRSTLMEYLPVFSKLSFFTGEIFKSLNWKVCNIKERQNLNLYTRALYNQNLCPAIINVLVQQKNILESHQIKKR